MASDSGNDQWLYEAAALLEWARTISKSNFQFSLHLIDVSLPRFSLLNFIYSTTDIQKIRGI